MRSSSQLLSLRPSRPAPKVCRDFAVAGQKVAGQKPVRRIIVSDEGAEALSDTSDSDAETSPHTGYDVLECTGRSLLAAVAAGLRAMKEDKEAPGDDPRSRPSSGHRPSLVHRSSLVQGYLDALTLAAHGTACGRAEQQPTAGKPRSESPKSPSLGQTPLRDPSFPKPQPAQPALKYLQNERDLRGFSQKRRPSADVRANEDADSVGTPSVSPQRTQGDPDEESDGLEDSAPNAPNALGVYVFIDDGLDDGRREEPEKMEASEPGANLHSAWAAGKMHQVSLENVESLGPEHELAYSQGHQEPWLCSLDIRVGRVPKQHSEMKV